MPRHEFGIMRKAPTQRKRFDRYEPQKYDNVVAVDNDLIEPILEDLDSVDCYWHTLRKPGKGLAFCGITLIPPESMPTLLGILTSQSEKEYLPLVDLIHEAWEAGKFIVHFGI